MIDERTERLITRRLDGELTEDESLDLDKRLIRSPEARQAFEESQRIDMLAVETLHTLLNRKTTTTIDGAATGTTNRPFAPSRSGRAGRWSTRRWLDGAIGIAAAVLLILVGVEVFSTGGLQPLPAPAPESSMKFAGPGSKPLVSDPSVPSPPLRVVEGPAVTEVIAGPRREQEHIDQDIIGVVDPETQSVYLLEIQTSRSRISRMRANY